MKTKIIWSMLAVGYLMAASCTKQYADINTNPYSPTLEQLEADGYSVGRHFPAMINAVTPAGDTETGTDFVNQYQLVYNLAGDCFSGFMGQAGDWGGNTNNLTYGFNLGWVNAQFNQTGSLMAAWKEVKNVTEVSGDSLQFAVAQVIKITGVSRATDMYGPIPYSDLESGTFTPAYEGQDSIYYSFFEELNQAIGILYELGAAAGRPLARYDMIYEGDYLLWAKYANSLKLRLAMRIAYADPVLAQRYAEEAAANPAGLLTAKEEGALHHAIGPAFSYKNPLPTLCVNYDEVRMGATMQAYLTGYNDPRIGVYFLPSELPGQTNAYVGVRSGINVTRSAYQPFSKLNVTNGDPLPWLRASEVHFLLAEGVLRGWNMGGTAQGHYEAGVRLAFEEAGVAMPAGYLTDGESTPTAYTDPANGGNNAGAPSTITIRWDEGAGFETKLERIITQKWIALYPNGQEAWSEFRRTGYPRVFPVVLNRSGGIVSTQAHVRRLPYPTAQYQQNGPQVNWGIALLGGPDNGGTKLWWDKK